MMDFNKTNFFNTLVNIIFKKPKKVLEKLESNINNIKFYNNGGYHIFTDSKGVNHRVDTTNHSRDKIWVDQTYTGAEDGSFDKPYKKLGTAFGKCISNSNGVIQIKNTYLLDYRLNIYGTRNITLIVGYGASITSVVKKYYADERRDWLYAGTIIVANHSNLKIILEDTDENGNKEPDDLIKINNLPKPSNLTNGRHIPIGYGMFSVTSGNRGFGSVDIINKIDNPNKVIINISHGVLFYRHNWDWDRLLTQSYSITSKTKCKIRINRTPVDGFAGGYLLNCGSTPTRMLFNIPDNSIIDDNDNLLDYSKVVIGHAKTSNGKLINLLINKVI